MTVYAVAPEHGYHGPWRGVSVAIEGFGSHSTYAVEQCEACGTYRKNDNPKIIWEDDDE